MGKQFMPQSMVPLRDGKNMGRSGDSDSPYVWYWLVKSSITILRLRTQYHISSQAGDFWWWHKSGWWCWQYYFSSPLPGWRNFSQKMLEIFTNRYWTFSEKKKSNQISTRKKVINWIRQKMGHPDLWS